MHLLAQKYFFVEKTNQIEIKLFLTLKQPFKNLNWFKNREKHKETNIFPRRQI